MTNETRWSAQELRNELDRYEEELRAAGKTRNTITTYVQHPERFIKWLEGRYRTTQDDPNWKPSTPAGGNDRSTRGQGGVFRRFGKGIEAHYRPVENDPNPKPDLPASGHDRGTFVMGRTSGRSSRYDPLRWYLAERSEPVIRLSFAEIARIIGAELPNSAYEHRAWWANEESGSHVHARSWLDAGRRTRDVDLNAATVDFIVSG